MSLVLQQEHLDILDCTGHLLISGGPGSGKTTIALHKAKKYIVEKHLLGGQNVLFLSFSRAAVTRIFDKLSDDSNLKHYKKQLTIQTFHSFFWEILKSHGYLLGAPKRLRVLAPHDEDSLREGRSKDNEDWLNERTTLFYEQGKVAFDLFAPLAIQILNKSKTINDLCTQKFPMIVIDEAQDTDTQQWECIEQFKQKSQLVLLADLDQQIHDYRIDVTPERINDIISSLSPTQISLSNQNHRSSGTEIVTFARDVLNDSPRTGTYNGVSLALYHPKAQRRDLKIRQSIGIIKSRYNDIYGENPKSIAFLATWGNGVKMLSHALRGNESITEIPHRVQFDETATYLSSRLIAFLLEPKSTLDLSDIVVKALRIIGGLYRAKGNRSEWEKLERWCLAILASEKPNKNKMIPELKRIIEDINLNPFTGIPENDWTYVKKLLLNSSLKALVDLGKHAEYLMAFNRGRYISKGLSRKWQETGEYRNARGILDSAITETQIISENNNQDGINVMTIHKAKGKEFDCVILFHNPYSSPFVRRDDSAQLHKSRRLLFVGITRARNHTLILKDASQVCPIVNSFTL